MKQFRMQISTQNRQPQLEKNTTNKNYILRKMGWKFQNPNFNNLCKIAFWNKQNWLNKELIVWSGLAR